MLYFLQEKFIFLPTKLPQNHVYQFSESFEEFFLNTPDGATLNGLHFKIEDPKGVILYFHGNAGDLSRWGEIATYFVKKSYAVIIMDYRTYGKSTGKLSEKHLFSDAQLFYNYALENYREKEITIYGRSLGAAIATQLASKTKPSKLVLETPFYNLYDVAKTRFSFLPLKLLLKYQFESNRYIQKVNCPITIFHGTEDAIVPYESGASLYRAANEPKEFITIEGGGHNDLVQFSTYQKNIGNALSIK
ncbi:alpha/beta hydrolase [Croceitalea rosinachiae]|uniref:Alpha/beta fold hydrolase n=1 Tax=Croceitalea rosinachiae TaxID=3075596 RepID=A0ABU3ABF7_9FLAO|nr:alpha/beta fold hydrolase [Croceitalea sp. F388]MDT0607522.1 alpha/beta fold hydrolase [Croceitalea sp. F388]